MLRRRGRSAGSASTWRIRAALIAGLVFWIFLAFRLALIQLVYAPRLAERAREQQIVKVRLAPERGTIYDRNMIALTGNLTVRSACAYPDDVKSPRAVADHLAQVLGGSSAQYLTKLRSSRGFVWIDRQLPPEKAARLEALNLPGIGLLKETKRVYPYGKRACHVVGLTDLDGRGIGGVECQMDTLLTGTGEWLCYCLNRAGRRMPTPTSTKIVPHDGQSVVLTIDLRLQSIAEVELERCVLEHNAAHGIVIIADPWTGEILAMANWPAFDPNAPSRSSVESEKNLAITDQFEPGSTFKAVTACAALSTGAADLSSVYYGGRGSKRFGWFTIREAEDHEFGWLDFRSAFRKSSNVCFAEIAESVGGVPLYTFAREFGFGCLTGISLPGEVRGTLREPAEWSGRSTHTIGFGQEVAVTALQLVGAYGAIANGGYLMEPRMVKAIVSDDGREIERAEPSAVRQVIAPEIAATMRQLLLSVTESGTGTKARVSEVPVGGKTGTAQKVVAGQRGFAAGKHVASFVGMAPAENPSLVCLVVIDEPEGKGFGGEVAAPVFARIMERIVRGPCRGFLLPDEERRGIDPSRIVGPGGNDVPEALFARSGSNDVNGSGDAPVLVESASRDDGETDARPAVSGGEPTSRGGARVGGEVFYADYRPSSAGQPAIPAADMGEIRPGTVVMAPAAAEDVVTVPDLRGMSLRLARRVASTRGLVLLFDGSGTVREQSPQPGGFVRPGQKVVVTCYPR
jgi:cell division protein FtsI (penicillin-binding protein 3)